MTRSRWTYGIAIVLIGAAVYASAFGNGFTFDDHGLVERNPAIRELSVLVVLEAPYWPDKPDLGLYRPLTTFSFAIDHAIWGTDPFGYHLTNVLLHLAASLLAFTVAANLFRSLPCALITGLVFALHPVQVEAVAGVVGRSELLAAAGFLGGWLFWIRRERFRGRSRVLQTLGAVLCYAAAVLSKEHAVTLLVLLAVWEIAQAKSRDRDYPVGRAISERWRAMAPLVVVVVGFLFLRSSVVGALVLPRIPDFVDNPLAHAGAFVRIISALGILGRYVGLLVFPLTLSADYSFAAVTAGWSLWLLPGLAVLGLAAWSMGRLVLHGERRIEAIAACVFIVPYLPSSNLFFAVGTPMAERLLYLPVMGFALFLGLIYKRLRPEVASSFRTWGPAVLVLGLLAGRTVARVPDWSSDLVLFRAAVEAVPNSAKAHLNLGSALRDSGEMDQAREAYARALEIYPDYAEAHYNMGVLHQVGRRDDLALASYGAAIAADSSHVGAWINRGSLLGRHSRFGGAAQSFSRAIQLDPDNVHAKYNFAVALDRMGRKQQAATAYQLVLEADPGHVGAAINLGTLYRVMGYGAETIAVYNRLLKARPDVYQIAHNLAVEYERAGKSDRALEAYRAASGDSGEMGAYSVFRMGKIFAAGNMADSARITFERFLERWEGSDRIREEARSELRTIGDRVR